MNLHVRASVIRTILLVNDMPDDHVIMRRKFSSILGQHIDVLTACTTSQAIKILQAEYVDLVLLDNHLMSEPNFRTSLPKLRQSGFTGPIGLVSSSIEKDETNDFEAHGADFRMGKDEIDAISIQFMLSEYLKSPLPMSCREDYLS